MSSRKREKYGKYVLAAAIIVIALIFSGSYLFSIAGNCPAFPSSITSAFISSSTATYPTGYVLASCENNFGAGTSLSSVVYQISYQEWLGAPVGYRQSGQVNVTIVEQPNTTLINKANANMSAQLPALNATILYDGEQAAQNDCGGCSIYSAEAWSGTEYVNTEVQQLLLKSIAYNNALLATVTTTGTTATTTATTTAGTTTAGTGTSTPPPQTSVLAGITNALDNVLGSFMLSLQSFWTQYFNVPSGLFTFSIAATNVSSTNVTTLGSQVTGTVNLNIPSSDVSTVWSPSVTYVVRTYCQAAYDYNSTPAVFANSSIVNMTSTSFSYTFPVKADEQGVIVFGGICETTNTTFDTATGSWSAWTPFKNVTVEHYAIYVAGNQTLTMLVTPVGSGIVVPPTGSHKYGTQETLGEQANTGYAFVRWQGTGRGNYTGTEVNPAITLNNNITETAVFQISTSQPPAPQSPAPLSAQWFENIWTGFTNWLSSLGL